MERNEKLQKYALVAEIVSAVAIVGSLIFVGLQIRQNTKSSEIAAYQTRVAQASDALVALALSEDMSGLRLRVRDEGVTSLSKLERERLRNWNWGTLLRMQGQYYLYQQGFLDRASVDGMLSNLVETYPSWIQLGLDEYIEIPELREEIEGYLVRHPDRAPTAVTPK